LEAGLKDCIAGELRKSAAVIGAIAADADLALAIETVARLCVAALRAGNKVLLAGNGGSAADAQHLAAEFVSRFNFDRPGLAAIALTTDTSALTAIGNDYGFEKLFSRQVDALGRTGDVFIALSTSGNSPNVLGALAECRARGIVTVGLTGQAARWRRCAITACACRRPRRRRSRKATSSSATSSAVWSRVKCSPRRADSRGGFISDQGMSRMPGSAEE
jgi:D-sedoheptulose 7-phosphate isomerase